MNASRSSAHTQDVRERPDGARTYVRGDAGDRGGGGVTVRRCMCWWRWCCCCLGGVVREEGGPPPSREGVAGGVPSPMRSEEKEEDDAAFEEKDDEAYSAERSMRESVDVGEGMSCCPLKKRKLRVGDGS